jgi:hypothetical protein
MKGLHSREDWTWTWTCFVKPVVKVLEMRGREDVVRNGGERQGTGVRRSRGELVLAVGRLDIDALLLPPSTLL